jgi:hypothetical protein
MTLCLNLGKLKITYDKAIYGYQTFNFICHFLILHHDVVECVDAKEHNSARHPDKNGSGFQHFCQCGW